MKTSVCISSAAVLCLIVAARPARCDDQSAVALPPGVKAVWDMSKAYRETTPSRQRLCINGLWRWQPAEELSDNVPADKWGYFKVPGCWPGNSGWLQKDSQVVFPHPAWKKQNFARLTSAWYQRKISVPAEWANRRIGLYAEYLNSFAAVYIDGKRVGDIRFPAGEARPDPGLPPRQQIRALLVGGRRAAQGHDALL